MKWIRAWAYRHSLRDLASISWTVLFFITIFGGLSLATRSLIGLYGLATIFVFMLILWALNTASDKVGRWLYEEGAKHKEDV